MASTCPRSAYPRPRSSRAASRAPSSNAVTQALPHHVPAKPSSAAVRGPSAGKVRRSSPSRPGAAIERGARGVAGGAEEAARSGAADAGSGCRGRSVPGADRSVGSVARPGRGEAGAWAGTWAGAWPGAAPVAGTARGEGRMGSPSGPSSGSHVDSGCRVHSG
ncbi:hypothetical protein STENM223S_08929 [Streptomyces tendae]